MTNLELNKEIGRALYPDQSESWYAGFFQAGHADYCSNWNKLMRAIHKVGVDFELHETLDENWNCVMTVNKCKRFIVKESPSQILASAECLLKVLKSK